MDDALTFISGVSERDIDLLLLEEFLSSETFQHWFAQQITENAELVRLRQARRSVTQSTGESDLEIGFVRSDGTEWRVLIENKVTAGFQPQQAERYQARARNYLTQGLCSAVTTVLVAPERYFGGSKAPKRFDAQVTYEAIREWFEQQLGLGARRHYKMKLLSSAIEKGTMGYQAVEDRPVTDFWHAYWRLMQDIAPELEMREPPAKPAGAGFVSFRPHALPRGVKICHKLPHGHVDLEFSGMADNLATLKTQFGTYLEPDMRLSRASKSGAIRIRVPVVSTGAGFAEQEKSVAEGQQAAKRLLAWFSQHRHSWASPVPSE